VPGRALRETIAGPPSAWGGEGGHRRLGAPSWKSGKSSGSNASGPVGGGRGRRNRGRSRRRLPAGGRRRGGGLAQLARGTARAETGRRSSASQFMGIGLGPIVKAAPRGKSVCRWIASREAVEREISRSAQRGDAFAHARQRILGEVDEDGARVVDREGGGQSVPERTETARSLTGNWAPRLALSGVRTPGGDAERLRTSRCAGERSHTMVRPESRFLANVAQLICSHNRGIVMWRTLPLWVLVAISCSQLNVSDPNDGASAPGPSPAVGAGGGVAAGSDAGSSGGPPVDAPVVEAGGRPQDPGCQPGYHVCAGLGCVDSRSADHCGTACSPCPPVRTGGGAATCDGTKCGVSCPAGQKPCVDACVPEATACDGKCPPNTNSCNALCVDSKSLSACGPACIPCVTSPNGVSTCNGDICELKCTQGYHKCGDKCLADNDPSSCGASCTPCDEPAGGKATCDGTKCGAQCPSGTKLCAGACIPMGQSCNGQCPAGKHDCQGNCVTDTGLNSCGTQCTPCTTADNADATCDGKQCGIRCRAGFHDCNGLCRSNDSVDSCGTRCSRCDESVGMPICRSGQCDFQCPGGRRCGNQCVRNDQPCNGQCPDGLRLCGGACVAALCCVAADCAQKSNQIRSCTNGRCSYDCPSNQRSCAGTCQQCCNAADCPVEVNKDASCVGGTCQHTCRAGTVPSGNNCVECGGDGQPCCATNSCAASLECKGNGRCGPRCTPGCSKRIRISCENGTEVRTDCGDCKACSAGACVNDEGAACGNRTATCSGDILQPVGICQGGICQSPPQNCADTNRACKGGQCVACGEINQSCCSRTPSCRGQSFCANRDFCISCGHLGEPCCGPDQPLGAQGVGSTLPGDCFDGSLCTGIASGAFSCTD
jgi:hypothetical protein